MVTKYKIHNVKDNINRLYNRINSWGSYLLILSGKCQYKLSIKFGSHGNQVRVSLNSRDIQTESKRQKPCQMALEGWIKFKWVICIFRIRKLNKTLLYLSRPNINHTATVNLITQLLDQLGETVQQKQKKKLFKLSLDYQIVLMESYFFNDGI